MLVTKDELEQYQDLYEKILERATLVLYLLINIPHSKYSNILGSYISEIGNKYITLLGYNYNEAVREDIPIEYLLTPEDEWLPQLTEKIKQKFTDEEEKKKQYRDQQDRELYESLKTKFENESKE